MANAQVTHELRVVALDGKTLVYKFTPRHGQVKVLSYKSGVPNSTASAYYTLQAARRLYTLIQRKHREQQLLALHVAEYDERMRLKALAQAQIASDQLYADHVDAWDELMAAAERHSDYEASLPYGGL